MISRISAGLVGHVCLENMAEAAGRFLDRSAMLTASPDLR
jgi:hypothetical protein